MEGGKQAQKKSARRSSGFGNSMKSKTAKRAEKDAKKAQRESKEL